jgi:hypothetical protein
MKNIELQSFYYIDTTIMYIVWRVQKLSLACVTNIAVGENKKTIIDLRSDDKKFVTLVHNDLGSHCYYFDEIKQCEDKNYAPVVEEIKDIETIARNIVKFLGNQFS